MIRILLAALAMIAVPFVIYFLYDLARSGSGARNPKDWERDSVLNLGLVGLFLAALAIFGVVATGGGSRDGTYTPARIENGKLIDGEFNSTDSTPERSLAED